MSISAATVAPPALSAQVKPEQRQEQTRKSHRGTDVAVAVAFILGALYVTSGLWADPGARVISDNAPDQVFFEWVLGYTAHALTHGTNPFFTTLMNAPLGVNVAANTGVTVIGIVLAPITLLFGAPVALVTALGLNLALTGYAWYWLFSRHLTRSRSIKSRWLAVAGGAFCGFGPGIIAHANGHVNFTAQFLIPLLVWRLAALTRTGSVVGSSAASSVPPSGRRSVRDGVVIGVLVAALYGIAAELLFFTGLAVGIYAVAWSVQQRRMARRIAATAVRPLATAAGVAAALLAYPTWMQFFGPQTYHGTGFANINASENLLSFPAVGADSLLGTLGAWTPLTVNPVEENSYFGPVLLIVVIWCAVRLCRTSPLLPSQREPSSLESMPSSPGLPSLSLRSRSSRRSRLLDVAPARALCATALVIAVMSLGTPLRIGHWKSHIPLPWALVSHLPLFGSALPGRFALLLTPIVAVILIATLDGMSFASLWAPRRRWLVAAVGALAIVPILPMPIPTAPRTALPRFITSGDWRDYVTAGATVLPVPPATSDMLDGQRWQVAAGFGFAISGGYFLGPGVSGRSRLGPVPRQTDALLSYVASTGALPRVIEADRAAAQADLAYWRTGMIVLPDASAGVGLGEAWPAHDDALLTVCTELFGAPQHVDDVWLWFPGQR